MSIVLLIAATCCGCGHKQCINAQETVLLHESPVLTLVIRNNTDDGLAVLSVTDSLPVLDIAAGSTASMPFTVARTVRLDRLIKSTRGWLEDTGEARTLVVQPVAGHPQVFDAAGMMMRLTMRTRAGELWAYDIELDACVFDSTAPQERELVITGLQDLADPFRWCVDP